MAINFNIDMSRMPCEGESHFHIYVDLDNDGISGVRQQASSRHA